MLTHHYRLGLLLACALARVFFSTASAATPPTEPVVLPACGPNPNTNTLTLQAAIDAAPVGSTLTLPSGVCVLATCEIAHGGVCYGVSGRHLSALYIGNKSDLTLEGAADGTSVLKLDPNPPGLPGHHAYCGPAHVLSIQLSTGITLRAFTIDGSDSELPHDHEQCPPNPSLGAHSGEINEHLHGVRVLNATDTTVDSMKLIEAHGDGLNLMAQRPQTSSSPEAQMPFTERVTVTASDFLANDRSGIAFQRNVGFVTIRKNYFHNSGNDQDLDMEPSGDAEDLGPYEVDIDGNLFERLQAKITVTLGGKGVLRSNGVRFTHNTIQPSAKANPPTGEGGCIFVYAADRTTIANNTVIGAQGCFTVSAQRATNLLIEQNHLESYANWQDQAGNFFPAAIDIRERVVNQGDPQTCGVSPKPPCPYFIYYPDGITIQGNTIVQHVQQSPAIRVSNADALVLADNAIEFSNKIAPVGAVNSAARAMGMDLPCGVRSLPSYGYYENERLQCQAWAITGNHLQQFADGIRIKAIKAKQSISTADISENVFNTALPKPRGISLEGATSTSQIGFIDPLSVDKNLFGCGFPAALGLPPTLVLPPNAYVRPSGQTHTGNIGVTIACQSKL